MLGKRKVRGLNVVPHRSRFVASGSRKKSRSKPKAIDYQGYHGEEQKYRSKKSHITQKIKGPDRGLISVVSPPFAKTIRPETTVLSQTCKYTWRTLQTTASAAVDISCNDLGPQNWTTPQSPIRGTGKGERVKDNINIKSWKMKIETLAAPGVLDGTKSMRLVILQILDDGQQANAVANNGYKWSEFFMENEPPSNYLSNNSASYFLQKHRYKVILDHYWPSMQKNHYEEITLGPHVMEWASAANVASSVPYAGRFIMFMGCLDAVAADNADEYGMKITHRLTYSDE